VLGGCEEKEHKKDTFVLEDIGEVFTKKDVEIRLQKQNAKTYTLTIINDHTHILYLSYKSISFEKEFAPLSLVTFFKRKNLEGKNLVHLNTLEQLQDRYGTLLFTLNTAMTSESSMLFSTTDKTFFAALSHSVSSDIKSDLLSILYVNGKYFTHYEGLIPIEMMQYDIEQAQKNIP
jgi:hypothetical protein